MFKLGIVHQASAASTMRRQFGLGRLRRRGEAFAGVGLNASVCRYASCHEGAARVLLALAASLARPGRSIILDISARC